MISKGDFFVFWDWDALNIRSRIYDSIFVIL